MGIQNALSKRFNSWVKRLHDYKIDISGWSGPVVRVTTTENMYGDYTDVSVVNHDILNISLDIPDEIPMNRLRQSVTENLTSTTQNLFMYDILPVIGYAKFSDNIAKDDYLIQVYYDQDPLQDTAYYLILQVTELIGNFNVNNIVNTQFQCSPYTQALTQEVQDIVDTYKDFYNSDN